jgi:hypothetical protein
LKRVTRLDSSLKKKILTQVLYTYATPTNAKWVRKMAKKYKTSKSMFIHQLIETAKRTLPLLAMAVLLQGCGKGNTMPVLVEVWGDWQTQVISGAAAHGTPVQFTHNGQTLGYCTPQTTP